MAMKPLPSWINDYEPKLKDSFDTMIPFWGTWVDENAQGIQVAPPYQSNGVTNSALFTSGLSALAASKDPVTTANILANAWQSWYLGITFPPSPPAPPFLTILSIVPSPVGVPAAFATLLSGLIAELAVIPPDPNTGFLIKGTAFGTLFNTATLAAGVQISGTAPGAPPVPLVLPLIPVL